MESTNNKSSSKKEYAPDGSGFFSEPETNDLFVKQINLEWESEKEKIVEPKKIDVSVFDVAAYILKKKGEMTTMKLHKLLYYAQAWSLVWDDAPLFKEDIEAWANGPVVKRLFSFHRGHYLINSIPIGNADLLSDKQKETVDSIINFYGEKPTQWLIDLTHLEEPWKQARVGLKPNERGDKVISHSSMAEYYSSIADNDEKTE